MSVVQVRSLFFHIREQKHGDRIISDVSESHMKLLGRLFCPDITDNCTTDRLAKLYWGWMSIIDNPPLYGPGKLWLYELSVLSQLNWPFIIYYFTLTLAKSWDRRTGVFLKKWAGVFINADTGILWRTR